MEKVIILTESQLNKLLRGEKNVEGYEGWYADADTSTGTFDSEKGAMTDYEITLYNDKGEAVYIAEDGYYTGPSGHKFYDNIKFTLIEEVEEPELLTKIIVWFSIQNGGDGSAYPDWFLTEEEAEYDQENMYEGWGESCIGSVETFVGSDIYNKALENKDRNYE